MEKTLYTASDILNNFEIINDIKRRFLIDNEPIHHIIDFSNLTDTNLHYILDTSKVIKDDYIKYKKLVDKYMNGSFYNKYKSILNLTKLNEENIKNYYDIMKMKDSKYYLNYIIKLNILMNISKYIYNELYILIYNIYKEYNKEIKPLGYSISYGIIRMIEYYIINAEYEYEELNEIDF